MHNILTFYQFSMEDASMCEADMPEKEFTQIYQFLNFVFEIIILLHIFPSLYFLQCKKNRELAVWLFLMSARSHTHEIS